MLLALGVFILLQTRGSDVIMRFAGVAFTREALGAAGEAMLRLLAVAVASMLFTLIVPLSHAIDGLRRLRVPAGVVAVAWMTERALVLLRAELRRVMDGVRARSAALAFPRRVLLGARIGGSFLVRAVGRSERMADAMTARGFDGRIPMLPGARWDRRDTAVAASCLTVIVLAVLL